MDLPARRWLVRGVAAMLVLALLAPSAVSALTYEPTSMQPGTIESPANSSTVIGVQGFKAGGQGSGKKPARLASVSPRGQLKWTYLGGEVGANWVYDVDPLPNGNVLVVTARNLNGQAPPAPDTLVYEFDPGSQETVWTEELPYEDTHDVDLINGDQLLVANMRNYNETTEENNDRIVIYNLTTGAETWAWEFAEHGYPPEGGGNYEDDWTHVNDVDKVAEGQYLVSPRNFDQAIVVNRSTAEVEMRLGSDGNYDIIREQHNPDLLFSEDGTPTILVADSENDRVVEYERDCATESQREAADCDWTKTWEVGTGQLNWPRDADRLPNGNTLITDTHNNRVIEVTPEGRIVWEFYATWGPYDAERMNAVGGPTSGGSQGPTIADMNAEGVYELSNSAGIRPGTGDGLSPARAFVLPFVGTPLEEPMRELGRTYAHLSPWVKPVWMTSWDFLFALGAALAVVVWGIAEIGYQRNRIRTGLVEAVRRV